MNILLINHYAGSLKYGMEYRPFYMAREWLKLGHQVTIVASSFSHLRDKSPQFSGDFSIEIDDGIQYIWLKDSSYQGNGIGRVKNILTFVLKLLRFQKKIIQISRPNLVIASSTYPLDIIPAFSISKKIQAKLIFEIHDLWPLTPIELGNISRWHPFVIAMQWAENFAYRNSYKVVSLLPKADSYMKEHGMAPDKFIYVPNGIDVLEWKTERDEIPQEHREILLNLKKIKRFIIGYVGAHGLANSLSNLIDAAERLQNDQVTFVLVGKGPEKSALKQKTARLRLSNVVFLPPVPKTSIPALLSMMDAFYIGWKKQPLYRFGICPNKLMDYMMAGKPVIHAVEAGNNLVDASGCGISIPPEDPGSLAEAVMKLMSFTLAERTEIGIKGREYVCKHHDYRLLAQKFLSAIELNR